MRVGRFGSVTYPQLLLAALTVAVAAATVFAAATSGAAFGAYNPGWDGTSELRGVADDAGAETSVVDETTAYDSLPANDTVAFVLAPREAYDADESARLRAFLERGGTVVVADDVDGPANRLLDDLGASARVDGDPLRDERNYYRSPDLPVAANVSEDPLVAGVDGVTLNHGTALEPGEATVLVRTSEYAYLDRNGDDELGDDERLAARPVATAESVGDGRVIAVGDPSTLINVMLERGENRAFARALVGDADRVAIDVSHSESVPPLTAAVLALRDSAALAALVGFGAVLSVAAWSGGRLRGLRRRVAALAPGARAGDAPEDGPQLSEREIRALLEREHPDWDEKRRTRVMAAIMNERRERSNDD